MSTKVNRSVPAGAWISVVAASGAALVVVAQNNSAETQIIDWAGSLPAASNRDGIALTRGETVTVSVPDGESLYVRNMTTGTTTSLIAIY